MKLLITQSSPASHHFIPLESKYSVQHSIQNTLSLCSSFSVRPSSTPIQNNNQN
jgi:hypothetical protein